MTQLDDRVPRSVPDVADWMPEVFTTLERRQVRYVALRVDESLFSSGHELDLLVHPRSLRGALWAVRSATGRSGLQIAQWIELPGLAASVIVVWPTDDGWQHYRFDVRTGIRKKGHVLFDGRLLADDVTMWDPRLSLFRLRDDLECALLVIRNHLDGRAPNERHQAIFRERGRDRDVIQAARALGWELSGSFEDGWRVRPVKDARMVSLSSATPVRYASRALGGRLRRKGFGMNIVLYGPDGVGKSTQATRVADSLRRIGIRDVHVHHHLVEVEALPERSATRRYEAKARAYRAAPRSLAVPAVVMASYLKKLLFVLLRVRPGLRRGESFVHDRYLLDVFQKLQRTRGVRLPFLEKILPLLSPREDFVFVLRAPPEVVSARTGELTEEGVRDAYELLTTCLGGRSSRQGAWIDVDAAVSAEQVHVQVLRRILAIQDARIRR